MRARAIIGTFNKKDGSVRKMMFVRLANLPNGFVENHVRGGTRPALPAGSETVWEVGVGWRTVNTSSLKVEGEEDVEL